ncbi:MAG TPA: hypothetical protein VGY55_12270 [Pirellulales bacterium]|jgi:hypothetical protein|nr:hypothetical protein [Pirellulales bacterium]
MAEHDLASAKYLAQAEDSLAAAETGSADTTQPPASSVDIWARVAGWTSYIAAAAVIACLVAVAVPYITAARSQKATSPIDWLIKLHGGSPDQTFEKFIRDSATANEHQWDEMYRKSPAYGIDPSKMNWNFGPVQRAK